MKRIFIFLVALCISAYSLAGCGDTNHRLAATPEQEYQRIQNLDGEGVIFNFSTIQKLQVLQNVDIYSQEIAVANSGNAIQSTLIFQLDNTNTKNVKSFAQINNVASIYLASSNSDDRIIMNTITYSYRDNLSRSGGYFSSYLDYAMRDSNSPDNYFRTSIKLFDTDKLVNIDGEKRSRQYTITASINDGNEEDFLEWFMSFFRVVSFKTVFGVYPYFKPETIKNISYGIKTNATSLLQVSCSFEVEGNPNIAGSNITISAVANFQKSDFEVRTD